MEKLSKFDGNNFKNLGVGIKTLSAGLKDLQGVKKSDFNRLATGIERLATIQPGNMETVGNSLKPLASGINILSGAKFDNKNLQGLINSLTHLSNANTGSLTNINFSALGNSIKELSDTLSSAEKVQQNTISITNAIAKLAQSGTNINVVTASLPDFGTKLKEFTKTMSKAATVAPETIAFTQAIGVLANAGKKAGTTADNLEKLGNELKGFFKTMSKAPNLSANTIKMTQALAQLANTGGKAKAATNSLSSSFQNLSKNSSKILGSLKGIQGGFKGLFKTISPFLAISNLFSWGKQAIEVSSNLTEVQNVVDVAFGEMKDKIEDLSKTSIKDFGMSELTAKQIASRFQAMGIAMGFGQEKMSDMSINLTKLAADMASFYNVEQEAVATSLQSVFTGETEPLRKYGLDLTQATLQQWAMKQGIDVNIQSMSQAEKTMLRYQYVLANTGAAQGDFSRTSGKRNNSFMCRTA